VRIYNLVSGDEQLHSEVNPKIVTSHLIWKLTTKSQPPGATLQKHSGTGGKEMKRVEERGSSPCPLPSGERI
jgi:hypothetical protein